MNIIKPKINWKPDITLRPRGIVVHAMMEKIAGYTAWDYLHKQGLSAHGFILEDNYLLKDDYPHLHNAPVLVDGQDTDKVAYHAGKSIHWHTVRDGDELEWYENHGFHCKDNKVLLHGLNNYYLGVETLVNPTPYLTSLVKDSLITDPYQQFKRIINNYDWLQARQFDLLVDWCTTQMTKYDILIENVVMHCDVSGDDVRGEGKGKIDVGNMFPRYEFYKALYKRVYGIENDREADLKTRKLLKK